MSELSETSKRATRQSQPIGDKAVTQFHLLFFDRDHSYLHIEQIKCSRKSQTEVTDFEGNTTSKTFVTLGYGIGQSIGEIFFSGTLIEIKAHMKSLPIALTPIEETAGNKENIPKSKYELIKNLPQIFKTLKILSKNLNFIFQKGSNKEDETDSELDVDMNEESSGEESSASVEKNGRKSLSKKPAVKKTVRLKKAKNKNKSNLLKHYI